MKTFVLSRQESVTKAAAHVCTVIKKKPDAVLAIDTGESCEAVYRILLECALRGEIDLSRIRFFAVKEYAKPVEISCRASLEKPLKEAGVPEQNCFFLTEENCARYDEQIAALGGLDLAILDIGVNARIGFNEPATPYDSRTHRQKLSPATRRELAAAFGGEERVPDYGLTMGIKTLVESRDIILAVSGQDKADAVFQTLYARDDGAVPAAFLQLPPNVTLYLDESAAKKL